MHLLKKCWQNIRVSLTATVMPGKSLGCRPAQQPATASRLNTKAPCDLVKKMMIKKGAEAPFYWV